MIQPNRALENHCSLAVALSCAVMRQRLFFSSFIRVHARYAGSDTTPSVRGRKNSSSGTGRLQSSTNAELLITACADKTPRRLLGCALLFYEQVVCMLVVSLDIRGGDAHDSPLVCSSEPVLRPQGSLLCREQTRDHPACGCFKRGRADVHHRKCRPTNVGCFGPCAQVIGQDRRTSQKAVPREMRRSPSPEQAPSLLHSIARMTGVHGVPSRCAIVQRYT